MPFVQTEKFPKNTRISLTRSLGAIEMLIEVEHSQRSIKKYTRVYAKLKKVKETSYF